MNKQALNRFFQETEGNIFGNRISENEIILLSFIKLARLINRIFPVKSKRKQAKEKLTRMMVDNQVSAAADDAKSAAQAVFASVAATLAITVVTR